MKRIFFALLALCLLLPTLGSCAGEVAVIDGSLGLGVYSALDTVDAETNDGGEGDIIHTAASVILDGAGKILSVRFDQTHATVSFGADGKAEGAGEIKTARELKDSYPEMADWYMQADVLEQKIEGKTLDEAKALVNEDGKGAEELQSAGCTMELTELMLALEKACNNAKVKVMGVVGGSVGMYSEVTESEDASEKDGVITVKTTFAATAAMPGGVINGAVTDEIEVSISFDKSGKSTTDLTKTLTTKRNLGDAYGMSKSGFDYDGDGRVLEWYAQADAFDAALIGRRPSGVGKMPGADGVGSESVIKAGCTIKITGMVKAVQRALENA